MVSLSTARLLWFVVPKALQSPSVGQLQGAISALQPEIARRKTAEQRLAETGQNLAVTLARSDANFIATDANGLVTRLHAVAWRQTGWQPADALGQSLWRVFQRAGRPADDKPRNPVDVMRVLA